MGKQLWQDLFLTKLLALVSSIIKKETLTQ